MTEKLSNYVLGFAFTNDMQNVLLIRKRKPEWQAGKLNGIGGKVEEGESPREAMVREFKEEAGVDTDPKRWVYNGILHGSNFFITVYSYFSDDVYEAYSETDEEVYVYSLPLYKDFPVLSNLEWMIQFALNKRTDPTLQEYVVRYL